MSFSRLSADLSGQSASPFPGIGQRVEPFVDIELKRPGGGTSSRCNLIKLQP